MAAAAVVVVPAGAITDGELDGNGHPAVVLVLMEVNGAPAFRCTGTLIAPTLPLARYVELGGALGGMPQCVYDPVADVLREPLAVDPERLAAEVAAVFENAREYEARSTAASAHVLAGPSFASHVRDVMAVIDDFVRSA